MNPDSMAAWIAAFVESQQDWMSERDALVLDDIADTLRRTQVLAEHIIEAADRPVGLDEQ